LTTITNLLTKAGEIYPPIVRSLLNDSYGVKYTFDEIEAFKNLDITDRNFIYWSEILYRSHWAATTNLVRHEKWFNGCMEHSFANPNYIMFSSALRGLLESVTDTYHSLAAVPQTLAEVCDYIDPALRRETTDKLGCSEELENSLIHFQFAKRQNKPSTAPTSHHALQATKYIAEMDDPDLKLQKLYSELCQVVHPAQESTSWLTMTANNQYWVEQPRDIEFILDICERHSAAIEQIQIISANTSIFIFKALNEFNLSKLHNETARKINMATSPLQQKIDNAFKARRK
jgi:hypothetical protein